MQLLTRSLEKHSRDILHYLSNDPNQLPVYQYTSIPHVAKSPISPLNHSLPKAIPHSPHPSLHFLTHGLAPTSPTTHLSPSAHSAFTTHPSPWHHVACTMLSRIRLHTSASWLWYLRNYNRHSDTHTSCSDGCNDRHLVHMPWVWVCTDNQRTRRTFRWLGRGRSGGCRWGCIR
jgi:hypothetical protein